jgi:hypothetical protein
MTDTKDVEFELRYAMGCYFGYPKVYVWDGLRNVADDVDNIKINNSEYDSIIEDCRTSLLSYY